MMRLTNNNIDMAKLPMPVSVSVYPETLTVQESILHTWDLGSNWSKVILSGVFRFDYRRPSDGDSDWVTFSINEVLTKDTYDPNWKQTKSWTLDGMLLGEIIEFSIWMPNQNTIKASWSYTQDIDGLQKSSTPCSVTITETMSTNGINIDSNYILVKGDVNIGGSLTVSPDRKKIPVGETYRFPHDCLAIKREKHGGSQGESWTTSPIAIYSKGSTITASNEMYIYTYIEFKNPED